MDEGRRMFFKELMQKGLAFMLVKPQLTLAEPLPAPRSAPQAVPAQPQ